MDKKELTKQIKMKALELGFSKVGITTADDFIEHEQEVNSRPDYAWAGDVIKGCRPSKFYPEGKSIICTVYGFSDILFPEELTPYVGRVYLSRSYSPLEESACGLRVKALKDFIKSLGISVYEGKLEIPARMACARAGITTFGNNNFAYTEEDGSFIILYTFIVDTELEYDEPTIINKCPPNCQECIKACPTHALAQARRMQPLKCVLLNNMVSMATPDELREGIGTKIHGCDICQLACPRNKKVLAKAARKDMFLEELKKDFDLEQILLLDEKYYQDVVYPIMYNYIHDMDTFRRNAAIALGNTGDPSHIPALKKALENENPLVQDAAQWAIDQLSVKSENQPVSI